MDKIKLDSKKYYYTFLDMIFKGQEDIVERYNWLIADYECNYYYDDVFEKNRYNYLWLNGKEMIELIMKDDIQFIWGAILAFDKSISLEEILQYDLPISHLDFDKKKNMQHDKSIIEIYSLDSSELFILSKQREFINHFLERYKEAKRLID